MNILQFLLNGDKIKSNMIYKYPNGRFVYLASPDSEEITVTPVNTLFNDPALWTFTDNNGKLYTPKKVIPYNQGTITLKENKGPLAEAVNNYLGELKYDINNNIPVGGKYTIPAIAATALLPLAGEAAAPTLVSNPYVNAALASIFAGHGLNHIINEGINGYGDAAMTALELAPLGRLAKPMFNESALAVENYRYPFGRPQVPKNFLTIKPQVRTRVGDVEIDNPQLFYRQGSAEMGDDFIKSGVVRTSGGFENPMYTEGALFKKVPTRTKGGMSKGDKIALEGSYSKTKSDLLVTDSSVDMIPADQGSGKNYTWFEDYMLDPFAEESIFDKSRVPLFNGTATSANTTAYRWEPGYGYRKVFPEETSVAEWAMGKTAPQITAENAASMTPEQWTAAQDAAIARGDIAEAQRLRNLHFKVNAPNSAAVGKDGFPLSLFHGTRTAEGIRKNGFSKAMSGKGNRGANEGNIYLTNSYENAKYTGVKAHEIDPIIDKVSSVYDLFGSKTIPSIRQIYSQVDDLTRQSSEINKQLYKLHTGTIWDRISTRLGLNSSPSNRAKKLRSIIDSNSKKIDELDRRARIVDFLDNGLSFIGGNRDRAVVNTLNFIKEPVNPSSLYRQIAADRVINAMYGTTDQIYSPEVLKLYGNFESPLLSDFKMSPTDINPLKTGRFSSTLVDYNNREKALLQELASPQYDSSISKNKFDILFGDVYITKNPNNLKLADAVTYDNNGVRIPLGKRDNFKSNDIRYSWLPWFLGGTSAATLYNVNK